MVMLHLATVLPKTFSGGFLMNSHAAELLGQIVTDGVEYLADHVGGDWKQYFNEI
ncbi:hypothetical protein D3C87_1813660 [compost metagenome]